MSKRTITELVCDLTGKPADETVRFGFDNAVYEIDLFAPEAGGLRDFLARYAAKARRLGKLEVRASGQRKTVRSSNGNREHSTAVRNWARQAGYDVAQRGRVSAEVLQAFEDAHRPSAPAAS